MGVRPDIRRMLVPIGPVAVFGASNFPLAFSVPGGDTASALAAGCPVVIKVHGAHPLTSGRCSDALSIAVRQTGMPPDVVQLVSGFEAGGSLVAHPRIRAVAFTGSAVGGRALMDIASGRPDPIPFYGELSGINPVVVTPSAARERGVSLGHDIAASFTLGAGQFCTKPGLVFVPQSEDGDAVVQAMAGALSETGPQTLLTRQIAETFRASVARLQGLPNVEVVIQRTSSDASGFAAQPTILTVPGDLAPATIWEECFGPVTVVVTYQDQQQLLDMLAQVPPSLTASMHLGHAEADLAHLLAEVLSSKAGRLIFNGQPTGVAVAWAQHHGGSWPSTNSLHSSVGPSSLRRFLRPTAWQDAPEALLPAELRDGAIDIPRRVDGLLVPAARPK